jgi:hypothetical protein
VLMPATTRVHAATLRCVLVCFIRASLRITSTMTALTPVAAVTEQVHRDEKYKNQNPEPICRKPCHDVSPSGLLAGIFVNT